MNRKTLVYIGGYGRSGSTILDCYLSSSSNAFGVGEASNIFTDVAENNPCSCGEGLTRCPVWGAFLSQYSVDDLEAYSRHAARVERMYRVMRRGDAEKYYAFWTKALAAVAVNAEVIIDSSKTTRYTSRRFQKIGKLFDSRVFVFLYRDPDYLIDSLMKGSNKFLSGREEKKALPLFMAKSFMGWLLGNFFAVLAARHADVVLVVNHEEFSRDPARLVESLAGVGVHLDPRGVFSGHGVSGNRVRSAATTIRPVPDAATQNSKRMWGNVMRLMLLFFMKFLPSGAVNVYDGAAVHGEASDEPARSDSDA